jgi:uncharacterized protein YbaP (TraB family)
MGWISMQTTDPLPGARGALRAVPPLGWAVVALATLAVAAMPRVAGAEPRADAESAAPGTTTTAPANAGAAAPDAGASADTPPTESLGEVEVVGERPGPGLWRVQKGDHTLYVLGTLRPLPKKMQWRSREVEDVIARAQSVIPESPDVDADVGVFRAIKLYAQWRRLRKNPDDATLDTVLPPELFARFETLRAKYAPRDRSLLELRPVIAAGELWQQALKENRLVARVDIDERVRKLAKSAKAEIAPLKVNIGDPTGALAELGRVPLDAEIRCMDAALDRLEKDVAEARTLADAWATGDVDLIRTRAPWARQQACWDALATAPTVDDIRRRVEAAWFDAAIASLEKHETTFAVASISELLKRGGVLEKMRARGYEVLEP